MSQNTTDDTAEKEQAIQMLADSLKEHVRECDGFEERDKSFAMAVSELLIRAGEWDALHWTIENAVTDGSLGPVGVADQQGVEADPDDREAVEFVAGEIQGAFEKEIVEHGRADEYGPVPETPEYEEPDGSFGLAVVRELARLGEWGALHFTADNARDLSGIGPVGVAKELDREPDASDMDTVKEVADAVVDCFYDTDADEYYGLDPSREVAAEGSDAAEKRADEFRQNIGLDEGDHLIYAELSRLEDAGVHVSDHRIVHTEPNNHPDYLEIRYMDVSADAIEDLRYRHIKTTDYYGVASRPLSEIEAR